MVRPFCPITSGARIVNSSSSAKELEKRSVMQVVLQESNELILDKITECGV